MAAPEQIVDASAYFPTEEKTAARELSSYIEGLMGSTILRISGEVRALLAQGREVCNLTIGDFSPKEFPVPASLVQATVKAFSDGNTNYPPPDGAMVLRKAVIDLYERELGLRYPLDSIIIASGARPLLYSAFLTLVDPGETVVYPVPTWNNNHYVYLSEADGVEIATRREDNFLLTAELLEPHIAKARLISINSPLNPTGTMYTEEQLRAICELIVAENRRRLEAGQRPIYLIYDQIYWMLQMSDLRHVTPVGVVPEMAAYTIFVDGISKGFAATGLRVGWLAAPPHVVEKLRSLTGHVGAWAPHPEQVASADVLNDKDGMRTFLDQMCSEVSHRLNALYDGFQEMRAEGLPVDAINPQGAIYLSARFDLIGKQLGEWRFENNDDIRRWLLEEAGMAVVPFNAFGLEEENGWMRLSVGAVSVDQIKRGLDRVATILAPARIA